VNLYEIGRGILYNGDVLEVLRRLDSGIVQTCITSPPYWGLRDYEIDGQLGLEKTPEEYVAKMVEIFSEVKRVLRDDGTLWLNLGDSYAHSGPCGGSSPDGPRKPRETDREKQQMMNYSIPPGLKSKDLCGIPWRVAFALQADGWVLRSDIIWCLSGGTRVYVRTQKGVMPMSLKDLYRLKPETVTLWNGDKWTQLKGMSKVPRTGDEIELVLRSGERISCTPNHKWPTQKGIVETKDLKAGDVLDNCFLPIETNHIVSYIPDEIGWFIGTYLAEGSRDSSGTIQIASHIKESTRYSRLKEIAAGYDGTCRSHKTSENGMVICLDGKVLNSIIDTYVAGKTAKDKHLTNACWKRNNSFLRQILFGYLQGDGHFEPENNRWRIGFTRNYNLEADIRTLCSRLGVNLTLKLSKSYIGTKKYDSFRGEIRFEATAKEHWNQKNKNEIVEIRKARARYFYNVGVEDDPHVFALASGILTHNSKPNPMPESVKDRPTKSHEYIFMFSKAKWKGPVKRQFCFISDQDARWLALFLDTEGNICAKRAKASSGNDHFGTQICFAGTSKELLETAGAIIGRGTILKRSGKNSPMYYLQLSNIQAADLLYRLYPFLIVKKRQAALGIYLQSVIAEGNQERRTKTGQLRGRLRDDDYTKELIRIWASMKQLNHFGNPDLSWMPIPKYGRWDSAKYFYDADAIREESLPQSYERAKYPRAKDNKGYPIGKDRDDGGLIYACGLNALENKLNPADRNKRTVWKVATMPYKGAHFASFPPKLIKPPILAGTSEKGCCVACGAPWERVVEKTTSTRTRPRNGIGQDSFDGTKGRAGEIDTKTIGWQPTCKCKGMSEPIPCTVLDCFMGAGTVALVAEQHNRRWIGIELSGDYCQLILKRLEFTKQKTIFQ